MQHESIVALAHDHRSHLKTLEVNIDMSEVMRDSLHIQAWICHQSREITLNGHALNAAPDRANLELFLKAHEYFHLLCLQKQVNIDDLAPEGEEHWADAFARAATTSLCSKS